MIQHFFLLFTWLFGWGVGKWCSEDEGRMFLGHIDVFAGETTSFYVGREVSNNSAGDLYVRMNNGSGRMKLFDLDAPEEPFDETDVVEGKCYFVTFVDTEVTRMDIFCDNTAQDCQIALFADPEIDYSIF